MGDRQLTWAEGAGALVVAGFTIWYWPSPWPIVIGLGYVAIKAFTTGEFLVRHLVVSSALASASRPMHMRWTLSVWLTERAWASLGVTAERGAELQGLLGTYEGGAQYLFEDQPTPLWVSNPITIAYEAWGDSLERWQVLNPLNANPRGNVQEFIPATDTQAREIVEFWPPFFRYQDGHLLFADPSSGSFMPDYKLFAPARVLFEIPTPTHRRRHWAWETDDVMAPNDLDQFAVPSESSPDGIFTWFQRQPTHERFVCVDREKGFRWEMDVHDLRHWRDGDVVGVRHRGFLRREVIAFRIRLDESRLIVEAGPQAVSPSVPGRSTLLKKGDQVAVICGQTGQVDRVWSWAFRTESSSPATRKRAKRGRRKAGRAPSGGEGK